MELVSDSDTSEAAIYEIKRLKKELAQAQMERDILKKAAAYFAKEALYNTHGLSSMKGCFQ